MPQVENATIENSRGQDMHVRVITPENFRRSQMRVMFHEHGRSGSMDYKHNQAVINAYLRRGYRVIALDAGNSQNNPSYGRLDDFSMLQHKNDLVDTIDWGRRQGLCSEKFALAAHSMGGFSALHIAAVEFRRNIQHVFAYAPVTDGPKQIQARYDNCADMVHVWKKKGFIVEEADETSPKRASQPEPKLTWKQFQEWRKQSIFPIIEAIDAPVYLVIGSKDIWTPASNILAFADSLTNCRGVDVIPGATHQFAEALPDLHRAAFQNIPELEQ